MHDNSWGMNMGWGIWIIPLVVILILAFFFIARRKK
jgi:preprotein translocase subunit YajC